MGLGSAHAAKGDPSVLLRSASGGELRSLSGAIVAPKGTVSGLSMAGITSVDALDDPDNIVIDLNIGVGNALTGLSWDVGLATVGASWLSEPVILFSDSTGSTDPEGIFLTVGAGDDAPGDMEYSSGGVIAFSTIPLPNITVGADGILRLQFFEDFDDGAGVDANWRDAIVPAVIAGLGLQCTNQAACDIAVGGAPVLNIGTVTGVDSCPSVPANNNSIIEPGELVNFSVPLAAAGGDFTNVVGTLTSGTAGVTIVSGIGNYGTIADGTTGTANFTIELGEAVACYSAINLSLAVSSTEGNFSFPIMRNVGAPAITYAGLPLTIPDNLPAGATSVATVAGMTGPITSLQVRIGATHTWVGDLIFTLTSPGGTTITLLDRPGVPATTFGCNNEDVAVTFQDGAADPESICGPVNTPWPVTLAAPVSALSAVNGQSGNGNWTLSVVDAGPGDTGTVTDWELIIQPAPAGTCTVCPKLADMAITLTDTPDPVTAGTNLTYVATATNAGPLAARDVVVSMPVPAGTTLVSATPSAGGACAATTCTFAGDTAVGASHTVTYIVAVPAGTASGTTLTGTATVAIGLPTTDPNAANNSATATTAVDTSANLALTLFSSVAQTPVNVPVTFDATSTNGGPSDAQNVQISIVLSPDFRYSSHSASAGATCTTPQVGNSGTITCTWAGATVVGGVRTLSVNAFSNNEAANTVSASTTSGTPDPVLANNSGAVSVQVGPLVEEIPTIGRNGMLLLGLMLALAGFVAVRRNS
jgi:uncharacterized repeat protein (TIGR01451 family)